MANLDEYQRTAAAFLAEHVGNSRIARNRLANSKGTVHRDGPTGIHPPRERNGRQKPSQPRVTVGPEIGLAVNGQEIQPMPEHRVPYLRYAAAGPPD